MAKLNDRKGSSTTKQRIHLLALGRQRGIDVDGVRDLARLGDYSDGSLRELSSRAASDMIASLGGGDLPNPPGQKPSAYAGRKPSGLRIITEDHVEQITRLGLMYFDGSESAFENWLDKNFKCRDPWKLTPPTAQCAGQVIRVLIRMTERLADKQETTNGHNTR